MSTPTIRAGTHDDLTALGGLWRKLAASERAIGVPVRADASAEASWRASFERQLGRFAYLWVAAEGEAIEGFVLARLKATPEYLGGELVGEIASIYVEPSTRGTGVGRALVARAIDSLRAGGAQAIEVDAHVSNRGACAFWEGLGFRTGFKRYRLDP